MTFASLHALAAVLMMLFASTAAAIPVDVVSPNRFVVDADGFDLEVPIEHSVPLDIANAAIERVIIVVHGSARNSDDHYARVQAASVALGEDDRTLVIAPQFLEQQDIDFWLLPEETLFWSSRWRQGNKSRDTTENPRPARISSFAVIDQIVETVGNVSIFPNLSKIVVAGHSAGGQVTQRYAGSNPVEDTHPGIDFRYVVANPSSYVYLGPDRWVHGIPGSFELPSAQQIIDCENYNEYKYGLDDPNSYIEDAGSATIIERYRTREVHYLLGALDILSEGLDVDCEAVFQGIHRLDRGVIYRRHRSEIFGASNLANQPLRLVPGVGHSSEEIYASDIGRNALFDSAIAQVPSMGLTGHALLAALLVGSIVRRLHSAA